MALSPDDDHFYGAYFGELVEIATKDFKIPFEVAERMADDVLFLAIFDRLKGCDPHMWLVRTMTVAAEHYHEINRVAEQLVDSVGDVTGWIP